MKSKLLFISLLCFMSFPFLHAQNTKTNSLKNEFSVDFFNLMFNKYSVSYDRLYSDSGSFGATVSYSPKLVRLVDDFGFQEKFSFVLNHKFYFSKKANQGFYIEGYLQYRYGSLINNRYTLDLQNKPNEKPYNSLDMGINFGYKYVNKQNFFFDAKAGFGRRITGFSPSVQNYYTNPYHLNFSVSIGKRF